MSRFTSGNIKGISYIAVLPQQWRICYTSSIDDALYINLRIINFFQSPKKININGIKSVVKTSICVFQPTSSGNAEIKHLARLRILN